MKHEIEKYTAVLGILFFVICIVVSVRVTEIVEADRAGRLSTCRGAGGTKLICGFKAVFGSANEN